MYVERGAVSFHIFRSRAASTASDKSITVERDAFLLPERQVGQMRPRNGVVSDLDRGVRLLPRFDAIQEVFDVRFGRDSSLVFVNRRGRDVRTVPRFGVDPVTVIVKRHRGLLPLEQNLPTVFVRVAVTVGPGGDERGVFVDRAEGVGYVGAFMNRDHSLA